jgi:hypothetical protein
VETKSTGHFPAASVAKGLLASLTGEAKSLSINRLMDALDTAVTNVPGRAKKAAEFYAVLIGQVFQVHRARSLAVRALGVVAFDHWNGLAIKDAWPMPNKREMARLRAVNWKVAIPSQEIRFLPMVVDIIASRWPAANGSKQRRAAS